MDRWDERFGAAVALEGDRAIIGAQFAASNPTVTSNAVERGAAYVFEYRRDVDGDGETDRVGLGAERPVPGLVALSGGLAVVGAWAKDAARGAAYVCPVGTASDFSSPAEDEIVQFGDPYTVRFTAPSIIAIDLYLVARSQSSNGARV